ncbi:hypothetical protein BCAR13_970019 [Paraburkholderia caribensis]|nr:hypothetical protein BCAR13_970019 [Paraburkholderia caribensis]
MSLRDGPQVNDGTRDAMPSSEITVIATPHILEESPLTREPPDTRFQTGERAHDKVGRPESHTGEPRGSPTTARP